MKLGIIIICYNNESDIDVHSTTDTTVLLSSKNYETETLILERLSTSMMKKLTKAFLHKELYIDNVKYIELDISAAQLNGKILQIGKRKFLRINKK